MNDSTAIIPRMELEEEYLNCIKEVREIQISIPVNIILFLLFFTF